MSRIPAFRRIAPADKRADGYHYLNGNWMGRPMPLFAGQNLGAVIGSDGDGPALDVFLQAFHASQAPLTNGTKATIPIGKSVTYDFALQSLYLERAGMVTIRVIVGDQSDAPYDVVAQTYPGTWGMFGSGSLNPLPQVDEITTLETQTGHRLCDEHRAFLETCNGINWSWWQDPAWDTSRQDANGDFYEALNASIEGLDDIGLLADANYIFGAGQAHPYLSYPENLGDFGFYAAAFLQFGIPVGVDGGGNLYVQILDGTRRGEIVFLDHEYHYGLLDDATPPQLAPDVREGAPDKPLEQFTADEFWAHMSEIGYALPAATSLSEMIEVLSARHTALQNQLAPKWRRP